MKKPRAMGLTCGIGSMLIGARQAGFKIIGNIDWRRYYHVRDEEGRNTFEENFPGAFFYEKMGDLSDKEMESIVGIDLVMSHTECGNWSNLRINKSNVLEDPADIGLFVDMVKVVKPRFFVMDDLPKMFIALPMSWWADNLPEYDIFPEWISNYHYGNPQKFRKRMFIIGALKSEGFVFCPGEEDVEPTVEKTIKDIPDNCPNHHKHDLKKHTGRACGLYKAGCNESWEELRQYFSGVSCGQVLRYHARDGQKKNRIGLCKGHWDGPSHVLTGTNPVIHPKTNLPYSLRERLRIQGAPDDFVLYGVRLNPDGTWNHDRNDALIKQTGKFMPVQFCRYISDQIYHHIAGREFDCSGSRFIVPNSYVNEAKVWFCENVSYSNQEEACSVCWIDNCFIHKKEMLGKERKKGGIKTKKKVKNKKSTRKLASSGRWRVFTNME